MKINHNARRKTRRTIKLAGGLVLLLGLAGCEALGLPDLRRHDEVPDAVKAEPRVVQSPTAEEQTTGWPRLGDVPSQPKDFPPKPVYEQAISEMEYHRDQGQAVRSQVQADAPTPDLALDAPMGGTAEAGSSAATTGGALAPPQFKLSGQN